MSSIVYNILKPHLIYVAVLSNEKSECGCWCVLLLLPCCSANVVSLWMGLTLADGDQTRWKWTNGTLNTWNNWANGQPRANMGCSYVYTANFSWASDYCRTTRPFLCQYQLPREYFVKR